MKTPVPPPPIRWPGGTQQPPLQQKTKAGGATHVAPPPVHWPGTSPQGQPSLQAKPALAPAPHVTVQPDLAAPQPATVQMRRVSKAFRIEKRRIARENRRALRPKTEDLLSIGKWNPRVGGRLAPPAGGMQEVQGIAIDGTQYLSANTTTTDDLLKRVARFNALENKNHFNQGMAGTEFERLKGVIGPLAVTIDEDGSPVARVKAEKGWISNAWHAEQNLLYQLAKQLAALDEIGSKVIPIFGTKAPCTTCLAVLKAFEGALKRAAIPVHLTYDRHGTHMAVGKGDAGVLNLSPIATTEDTPFHRFKKFYQDWRDIYIST